MNKKKYVKDNRLYLSVEFFACRHQSQAQTVFSEGQSKLFPPPRTASTIDRGLLIGMITAIHIEVNSKGRTDTSIFYSHQRRKHTSIFYVIPSFMEIPLSGYALQSSGPLIGIMTAIHIEVNDKGPIYNSIFYVIPSKANTYLYSM
jgi:hypothetical protein